jgi:hypothetical protein
MKILRLLTIYNVKQAAIKHHDKRLISFLAIDSIERPIKVETSFSARPKTRKLLTVDWSRLWKQSLFHVSSG